MKTFRCVLACLACGGTIFLLAHAALAEGSLALLAVEKQFEARAYRAGANLEKLEEKLKKMGEEKSRSKEGRLLLCEVMLESAYGAHLALKGTMQKTGTDDAGNKTKLFHLVLNGGEAGLFDMVYKYSPDGELIGTVINELPKNWSIIFLPRSIKDYLAVETDTKSRFLFNIRDPFEAEVLNPAIPKSKK